MTDATGDTTDAAATDPATEAVDTTPVNDDKPPFMIAVTMDGHIELAGRVDDLEDRLETVEAAIPAHADDDDDADMELVHDRLDRHRAEIEEIKRRYNQVVKFIGANVPNTGNTPIPAPAPATSFMQQ